MSRTFVADEMIGRALFGIAAVLFWVFLIAVGRQGYTMESKSRVRRQSSK